MICRRKNDYKIGTSEWYNDEGSSTTFLDQEQFPTSSRHSCKKHISKYHQRKTNKSMVELNYFYCKLGALFFFIFRSEVKFGKTINFVPTDLL